ncbi:hypothetical protein F4821DRAFT_230137 [Hypoxylon rubiginosum]|uniref:Uncharacterized protein n=1 Tax=Hypoxylon rubiginosum TaxID=110542 RepID=A0ACC0DB08_9PEZI|nr:hypothetical protein F4821DRAFT_230137 [Hypoxylon rubiginosum]
MMFKSYAFVLLPAAVSVTSAALLPKDSSPAPRAACWSGQIHSPCEGFSTGCTPDGIMVECQASSSAMIYSEMCGCCAQAKGTCTYDDNCNASCAA